MKKLAFFQDFVASQMADSFSLYMLELFPGSKRHSLDSNKDNKRLANTTEHYHRTSSDLPKTSSPILLEHPISTKLSQCIHPDDDKVLFEYELLADSIQSS